jgi:hypothetical protein
MLGFRTREILVNGVWHVGWSHKAVLFLAFSHY